MQSSSRFFIGKRVALAAMLVMCGSLLPAVVHSGSADPGRPTSPSLRSREMGRPLDAASALLRQRAGHITQHASFLGTIVYSVAETSFFGSGKHVTIDVGTDHDLQVGERLTIFRLSSPVYTPQTGKVVGRPVLILGEARVERVRDATATILITQSSDVIELGDRVQRFGELSSALRPVARSPHAKALAPPNQSSGAILAVKDDKQFIAQGDIVYVDQGAEHGVRLGDRLVVMEDAPSTRHPDSQHRLYPPPQAIGTLTVVGVQARTSTALVINSQHEFTVGSPVESAATTQDSHSAWDQLMARVATLSVAIPPCLERARQAIRTAEMIGASRQDLAAATNTLAYATSTFQQAQEVLNHGKREQALALLEAAQSDCLTAQQLANQAGIRVASRTPPSLDSYTVQRGDTLWDISALELIYRNPLLWPILYKANRDHIRDPDVIVPTQTLTVPRSYTPEEATAALRRARARGPWQLGDGPDFYVLEGVRP